MPQAILIQVGQCGNQIAYKFWQNIMHENSQNDAFIERDKLPEKARAVLVDMEPAVISSILKSKIGSIFDADQVVFGSSGSGNNCTRIQVEKCDALATFFILNSLGGGTGSGLGSLITQHLSDEFPAILRINAPIVPSANDDVIVAPYNTILSLNQLIHHSDMIIPIENQALIDKCHKSPLSVPIKLQKNRGYSEMNNIVAELLCNITSSMRFNGPMNVDMSDITTNLIPFPRQKFIISSTSNNPSIDALFTSVFSKDSQMCIVEPRRSMYLACALIARGNVKISDFQRNIVRIRPTLDFVHWNKDAWKTGICDTKQGKHESTLLCMANNQCVKNVLLRARNRFLKLYRRKANVHHYSEYVSMEEFKEAVQCVNSVISEYS